MARCPRVGCAGLLDGDGFCDSCGLQSAVSDYGGSTEPSTPISSDVSWWTPSVATSGSTPSRSPTSGRGMLGAGLVDLPPVPYRNPDDVVVADPRVPEHHRFCGRCGAEVGRTLDGRAGRTEGFCARCGRSYSFTPSLRAGQVVHDQYEVLGCIAHGGLGWIYLARDHAVSDRWVVLKGVIDSADADATAAAIAERHFLAQVEHPNIVKIHNFVQHNDPSSGNSVGYIVMEYIGGQSLKEMLKQRRREHGPQACLPIEQALAYTIEALRPLGYLHQHGLLYCDVKPDNLVQAQEQLKLIDLGAVRRADDTSGAVYGTAGYQAPEISERGPSAAADLYAIGRTLAVLAIAFPFTTTYATRLPPPSEAPVLAEHESVRRALLRACHPDPDRRFASAAEMAEQLTGVLREVLAASDGQPRHAVSPRFGPEVRGFGIQLSDDGTLVPVDASAAAKALPVPRVDSSDSAADLLTTLAAAAPDELLGSLRGVPSTTEVRLRRVRARIELGEYQGAVDEAGKLHDTSWRAHWARGLALLAAGEAENARLEFDSVLGMLPGELAAKLALALCAERIEDIADAERYYRITWRTDRSYVSAAFGLSRVLLAKGDRAEAVAVLGSVPATSVHHVTAQATAVRVAIMVPDPATLTPADLALASERVARIDLDDARRTGLEADLLETTIEWVRTGGGRPGDGLVVLDCPLDEESLRLELERRYRALARHASTVWERYTLVDRANQVRPWTTV